MNSEDLGTDRDFCEPDERDWTDSVLTTPDDFDFDTDERVMVVGEDKKQYIASDCWILRIQDDFGNSTTEVQRTGRFVDG